MVKKNKEQEEILKTMAEIDEKINNPDTITTKQKLKALNVIEESLQHSIERGDDNQIDSFQFAMQVIAEMKKENIEFAKLFMSPDDVKTEITSHQRTLLSLLTDLAKHPYISVLDRIDKKKYPQIYKKVETELQLDVLTDFINNYKRLGIAVNRKGRLEDLKAMTGLFKKDDDIDIISKARDRV